MGMIAALEFIGIGVGSAAFGLILGIGIYFIHEQWVGRL